MLRDHEEREELLFSLVDTATWWLQPEMKKKLEEETSNVVHCPTASLEQYAQDLRDAGATEAYIKKELMVLSQEQEVEEEESGDDIQVIKGPPRASK